MNSERYYQCFVSKKERDRWEKENKGKIKVCMRMPVKQLAKEIYLPEETQKAYQYATIYRKL